MEIIYCETSNRPRHHFFSILFQTIELTKPYRFPLIVFEQILV